MWVESSTRELLGSAFESTFPAFCSKLQQVRKEEGCVQEFVGDVAFVVAVADYVAVAVGDGGDGAD